jgi:hypothetical protein
MPGRFQPPVAPSLRHPLDLYRRSISTRILLQMIMIAALMKLCSSLTMYEFAAAGMVRTFLIALMVKLALMIGLVFLVLHRNVFRPISAIGNTLR